MVFAASQGGVENELESYLDSRTVGSGAGTVSYTHLTLPTNSLV